jgi:hypothetical protein
LREEEAGRDGGRERGGGEEVWMAWMGVDGVDGRGWAWMVGRKLSMRGVEGMDDVRRWCICRYVYT